MDIPPLSSRHALAEGLAQSLVTAESGSTGMLLVGPAGIGKSHLIGHVARLLSSRGIAAVPVTGSAAGVEIPLAAFAAVMAAPDFPPGGTESTTMLIRHLSSLRGGAGLLVDNADRLDAASLFVVQHCIRDVQLPVLLTVRDLSQLPDALHELYDAGALRIRHIEPLGLSESLDVATALLGGRLTPRTMSILLNLSGGIPLYIRELIVGSRESGALVSTDHGWDFREPPQATPRLAELVGNAFETLEDDAVDLAGMLAVTDGIPAALLDDRLLRTIVRRGVGEVDQDGIARLAHPLYGEAINARTPAPMLSLYRGRALDLLIASHAPDTPMSRAQLVALAVADGRPVATAPLLEEAQRAQGLMDHDLAYRLSRLALDAEPDHPLAMRVAGAAASGRGDDHAETLLRRALELARDEPERGSAARSLAHHLAVRGHDPLSAAELLTAVLPSVQDPAERSRLEHDLLQWQMVGGTMGVIPPPPDVSSGASYAHHLAVSLMVSLIVGPLDDAESTSRRLEEHIPVYRDEVPTGPAIARLGRFMLIAYRGDILAAREVALSALRLNQEQPEMRGAWEYSLGMIELLSGDIEATARLASEAVDHLRWRDPLGLLPAALALGEAAAVALGDLIGADVLSAQIPEPMLLDPKAVMLRAWASAWRERAAGRPGRAAEIIATTAEQLRDAQHVFLAGMLAHCASRLGHAGRVLPVLATLAGSGGVLEPFLAHAEAVETRDADGLADLAARFDTMGIRSSAVDAMVILARWARARGDVMTARRWDWKVRELMAQSPPMALWMHDSGGSEPLGAREREVALLAANRLSAREIGEQLGISPKTVANQLASVYRKLGVSGRAELREMLD